MDTFILFSCPDLAKCTHTERPEFEDCANVAYSYFCGYVVWAILL